MHSLTQAIDPDIARPRSGDHLRAAFARLCKNYPPCADKLVSRASVKVTFGLLFGPVDLLPAGLTCTYPSHDPELKRWAFPIWFAESYLSSLGRAVAGTLPRGASSKKGWRYHAL